MASFSTEAIVLRHSNYGEADRMLTVLTPFKGKLRVVAKGVRRITSRRAGNVEPLNKVTIQMFQGTGMPILTEAQSISTFPKIKSDLILSSFGYHVIELAERLAPEEQANPNAYQLLGAILELLEKNPRQLFIRAYEVKLLSVYGFWSFEQIQTSPETKELLDKLQKNSWSEINEMVINKSQSEELERIMYLYLEKVLESPLKSIKMLQKLKS